MDEGQAMTMTTDFGSFLDEHRDELTALRILYGQPAATKRLTYASMEDLRDAMMRPPWLLEPLSLWSAYRRLQGDKVRANPAKTLTDLVALVRFAIGTADTLAPLSSDMAGRFNLWLPRTARRACLYAGTARLAGSDPRLSGGEYRVDRRRHPGPVPRAWRHHRRAAGFRSRLDVLLDDLQDALVACGEWRNE